MWQIHGITKGPLPLESTYPVMAELPLSLDVRFPSPLGKIGGESTSSPSPDWHTKQSMRARAGEARLRCLYGQDGDVRGGRLVTYMGTDQTSKYIKDIGSQVSCCQKRELQIWKGKMDPVVLDWNWRYGCANTSLLIFIYYVENTDVSV